MKANTVTENDVTECNVLRGGPRDSQGVLLSYFLESNRDKPKPFTAWLKSEQWKLWLKARDASTERSRAKCRATQDLCKHEIRARAQRSAMDRHD